MEEKLNRIKRLKKEGISDFPTPGQIERIISQESKETDIGAEAFVRRYRDRGRSWWKKLVELLKIQGEYGLLRDILNALKIPEFSGLYFASRSLTGSSIEDRKIRVSKKLKGKELKKMSEVSRRLLNKAYNLGFKAGKEDYWMVANEDALRDLFLNNLSRARDYHDLIVYFEEDWQETTHWETIYGRELQSWLKDIDDPEEKMYQLSDLVIAWWEGYWDGLSERMNVYKIAEEVLASKGKRSFKKGILRRKSLSDNYSSYKKEIQDLKRIVGEELEVYDLEEGVSPIDYDIFADAVKFCLEQENISTERLSISFSPDQPEIVDIDEESNRWTATYSFIIFGDDGNTILANGTLYAYGSVYEHTDPKKRELGDYLVDLTDITVIIDEVFEDEDILEKEESLKEGSMMKRILRNSRIGQKTTLKERLIEEGYDIRNDIIYNPGKFEGQLYPVVYFYNLFLDGFFDGEIVSPSGDYSFVYFSISEDYFKEAPDLREFFQVGDLVGLEMTDDGSVYFVTDLTEEDIEKLERELDKESEDFEEDID